MNLNLLKIFLFITLTSAVLVSCTEADESISQINQTENVEQSTAEQSTTDSEELEMVKDVTLLDECFEKGQLGVIKGVSQTALFCYEDEDEDGAFFWGTQSDEMTLMPGDSCYDSDNRQYMYTDGISFSSRVLCVNGIFVSYPPFNESDYVKVSERELKFYFKNLPENVNKKIVVYGQILNMTRISEIQADVSHKKEGKFYLGFDDAFFYVETELTKDLVVDDEFKAWVTVRPHETFESSGLGTRTIPAFRVDAIERVQ